MKIGLVLEGGAMRGMYTAGVLDVFMENEIEFDGVVGTSAGALFGVNLLSKQKGRVIRYNKRFNSDKRYMGIYPLIKEGNLVSTDFAYGEVPRKLDIFDDETYKKSDIPFYAVLTDLETGEAEYARIKSVFEQMDTLRASGTIPIVSKPVEIDGRRFFDGGISDSIAYEWLAAQGYDKLVVVLTRDITYRKTPISKNLIKLFYHKYPRFAEKFINRHNAYNESVERLIEWEKEGRAFVIRPTRPIKLKTTEKDNEKLQSVYELGIADAEAVLGKLSAYMAE